MQEEKITENEAAPNHPIVEHQGCYRCGGPHDEVDCPIINAEAAEAFSRYQAEICVECGHSRSDHGGVSEEPPFYYPCEADECPCEDFVEPRLDNVRG